MNTIPDNLPSSPLAVPQRETTGATTFEKYEYQYHWALCKIINEHETLNDYVVFIELHEDVVIANSTDQDSALFEFNQIKNVSNKPWTQKDLVRRPNKTKNSVLGKMLLGVRDKPFQERIVALNLVATCGFDLPMKKDGLNLSVISVGDITETCLSNIQQALDKEIGEGEIPKTLTFATPDLPPNGFQDASVGKISKLIDSIAPGMKCNAQNIYRVLIDDLHKKGTLAFDYKEWITLVRNKGLTKSEVERVISAYTESKDIELLRPDFDAITEDLALKYHEKVPLRQAWERYHHSVTLSRSLLSLEVQAHLQKSIDANFSLFQGSGSSALIDEVAGSMPEEVRNKFATDIEIRAAIIYELCRKNHE